MEQKGGRLIIVSNRLPFNLIKKSGKIEIKESDGGLVSALKSYFESIRNDKSFDSIVWVGSAEFSYDLWESLDKKKLDQISYTVEPVFIDKKNYSKYYNGFSNATLWPLFHYFPSFVEFDNDTFNAYEQVNIIFANKILSTLLPNDVVWIHDYQLMLLPHMIRYQFPKATIGFFLHIPFPSFEIFRLLHRPWKEKIIDGILGADLVGFHTHEYVQHFLKTVQMIKGYDHRFRSIFLPDRILKAEMFPLGIDFSKFNNAVREKTIIERRASIENNFPGKKIIFSVDRLDYTKGITHRLSGFERFLELYSQWREKVVFILVVVPSRQIVSKYNERKKLIEEEIGRINGKYSTLGWQPIIYQYNNLSFHELVAMYSAADIALITPLRDGMNLVAKEYIASREESGVLILSELAGAASELSEAILVNPMDREEVSEAISHALRMPEQIQKNKIHQLKQRIQEYTVNHWFWDFLHQLTETKSHQLLQQTKQLSSSLAKEITTQYHASSNRLILLDYDGTLVGFSKHPADAIPDGRLMKLLTKLSSDVKNSITIISGRDSDSLQKWFGDLPVNLISEHGAGLRLKNQDWHYGEDIDQHWKSFIWPMLELFQRRSPGSFIEEKRHTLVWHYRNVDHELGFIRSRELLDNLHHLVRNANLNVIDGNKVIEIRVSGIDKGVVTKKLMDDGQFDFIMAIGDDKTDEDMFRVLEGKAYTLKIGTGHTLANYNLSDQSAVISLLQQLSGSND